MLYYFQTPPTKSLLKLKSKRQKSHVELPTLAATDLASTGATNKPINPLKPNNFTNAKLQFLTGTQSKCQHTNHIQTIQAEFDQMTLNKLNNWTSPHFVTHRVR